MIPPSAHIHLPFLQTKIPPADYRWRCLSEPLGRQMVNDWQVLAINFTSERIQLSQNVINLSRPERRRRLLIFVWPRSLR